MAGHVDLLHPRPVDEEQVEVVRAELLHGQLDGSLAPLPALVLGPQLGGEEDGGPGEGQPGQLLLQGGRYGPVVPGDRGEAGGGSDGLPVDGRGVDAPVTRLQGRRQGRLGWEEGSVGGG